MMSVFILWSVALLLSAHTFQTTFFAIICLLIIAFPILFYYSKKIWKILLGIIILWIVLLFPSFFQENNAKDGKFELVSLSDTKYNFNPLNVVEEREFLDTGMMLSWAVGITDTQLQGFIEKVYQYEKSTNIYLPSQLPNAVINIKEKKYFLYTPENAKDDEIIMVLNGSMWAFQFYQKYFKQYADEFHLKMVSPIFGGGNWNEEGGVESIFDAYNDLVTKKIISPNTKVILFWVSNGWRWLTRAVYFDNKNIFSKIVYISWLMESEIINSKTFQEHAKNKEFYVIHGKSDDRALYKYFLDSKNSFQNLHTLLFEKWDHFILLNEEEKIIPYINSIIEKK